MVINLGSAIAANWNSGAQCVGDVEQLRVQLRMTGFTGSVSIEQGESATALFETKASGALVAYTGSQEYYDLRPSTFIKITVAWADGVVDEVLLAWGHKR